MPGGKRGIGRRPRHGDIHRETQYLSTRHRGFVFPCFSLRAAKGVMYHQYLYTTGFVNPEGDG